MPMLDKQCCPMGQWCKLGSSKLPRKKVLFAIDHCAKVWQDYDGSNWDHPNCMFGEVWRLARGKGSGLTPWCKDFH